MGGAEPPHKICLFLNRLQAIQNKHGEGGVGGRAPHSNVWFQIAFKRFKTSYIFSYCRYNMKTSHPNRKRYGAGLNEVSQ